MKPLCFVIMPFNTRKDADGKEIDFNLVYKSFIAKAIENAGMEAIRADEETVNGIIHKPMYERLILCDYAIADLTTANANVFYELGIRHAVKPFTTITIFAAGTTLPFDVNALRCQPYTYDKLEKLSNVDHDITALTAQLANAIKSKNTDSPVYQLIDGISFQNSVAHQKTDIFRDQVAYNQHLKDALHDIRSKDIADKDKLALLDTFVSEKIDLLNEEAGVLIDVLLSYRSSGAIKSMIEFIGRLPAHIRNTVMIQEQLGYALNRNKQHDKAIEVLEAVIAQHGPSSETYGIMGRAYKDMYDAALKANNEFKAEAFLDKAIDTYKKGVEADWRDAYPGTNLLTLLAIKGDDAQMLKMAPVVRYAIERKISKTVPDYWDYASLMEIEVIEDNHDMALENFKKLLGCTIEGDWMFDTTINNLGLLKAARDKKGLNTSLVDLMIGHLNSQKKQ